MAPEIPASLPGPAAPQQPASGDTAVPAAFRPRHARPGPGRPQAWLLVAAGGLCVLSAAAATVSYAAQYRLVDAARHLAPAAALEAAIPDAAALVFACLGVALAVNGRRAVRARLLNVASAGASVFMNVIAAAPGWRNLAVWAMPPAAYALASDTLIGVVRTGAVARRQDAESPGGGTGEVSLLAAAGGLALWLLRLVLAPGSTLAGFRRWVVEECPVAPGRRAAKGRPEDDLAPGRTPAGGSSHRAPAARPAGGVPPTGTGTASGSPRPSGVARGGGTKTARFLALVAAEHGPLAGIPLGSVARICAASAPLAGLNAGSARKALRRAVLAAQDQQNQARDQNTLKGDW